MVSKYGMFGRAVLRARPLQGASLCNTLAKNHRKHGKMLFVVLDVVQHPYRQRSEYYGHQYALTIAHIDSVNSINGQYERRYTR
jgi:hypothetical protein